MLNSVLAVDDARALAEGIVNTIHEPFLALDGDLRVVAASRSFYEIFKVDPEQTHGCLLYDLGDGQWDIPALRVLLETIIPEKAAMDGFEVEHDFPGVGRRIMLLNARMVRYETSPTRTILLAFTDVTERRAIEQEKAAAQALAEGIVNTIHEPFLSLDGDLRVVAASRSFYEIFKVDPEQTHGCLLYDLGDGQWDIPALRVLLETIIPEKAAMDGFEVEHDFPGVGRRIMLLNARMIRNETSSDSTILLAFTDVTARRAIEQEKAAAQALAEGIVNTIHEPFLSLDGDLRVVAASRSFYEIFKVDPEQTHGCLLYDLGDGQWDIPALRVLLETIIPEKAAMDGFEVEHDFPGVGRRTMLLNARMIRDETSPTRTILLAFTDVTERRAIEQEKALLLEETETLLRQKRVLLQEMEHRVANSLQIIASILMIKARAVTSDESRQHLRDAHERVMSVAAVQSHLHSSEGIEEIEVGAYLTKLCGSLATSMIGESRPTTLVVEADDGLLGSGEAVRMGLIVTELVINALKYAFPEGRADPRVKVTYVSDGPAWTLSVVDNGIGKDPAATSLTGGLGTVIVNALVKQLDARMMVDDAGPGHSVSITHAAVPAMVPEAA